MILARIFSLRCFSTKDMLSTPRKTSCMMSVDYRKMVAKQLGLPEPPRGPLSPYFRFIQHHKKEIQKRFPDMSNQEIAIRIEHMWQQLSFDEKNKWSLQFDQEKVAHNVRYKNYLKTLSLDQIQNMKYIKKKHILRQRIVITNEKRGIEVEKPKSPGNVFTLYLKTLDRGESRLKEFMHTAACKWNKLTKEEKNVFHEKAKTLEEQYQNELSFWEMKMLKTGRVDLVEKHQQLVELKSFATQNSSRIFAEQVMEVTPQASKREPLLTLSDGSATQSSTRIIEEQHGKVNPQSVKIEAQFSVSDDSSKRYKQKIIFK